MARPKAQKPSQPKAPIMMPQAGFEWKTMECFEPGRPRGGNAKRGMMVSATNTAARTVTGGGGGGGSGAVQLTPAATAAAPQAAVVTAPPPQ